MSFIPLSYILIPFILALGVWFFLALFNMLHVVRYGYINFMSYIMTFIFIGSSIIIIFSAYTLIMQVDLTVPLFTL